MFTILRCNNGNVRQKCSRKWIQVAKQTKWRCKFSSAATSILTFTLNTKGTENVTLRYRYRNMCSMTRCRYISCHCTMKATYTCSLRQRHKDSHSDTKCLITQGFDPIYCAKEYDDRKSFITACLIVRELRNTLSDLMQNDFSLAVDKMLRRARNFWFSSGLWKWLVYYISRMLNVVYCLKSEIWLLNTMTSKSSFWILDSWRRDGYVVQKHRYRITPHAQ